MTKFGKRRKSKSRFQKQLMGERQLITRHMDVYQMWVRKGYTHEEAVKRIREKDIHMTLLEKLKQRYKMNLGKVSIQGITTQGIRNTEAVRDWVKSMVKKEKLIISFMPTDKSMPITLYYPKDIKLHRMGLGMR